ncbi:GAF and ANTAR domain-containing protein [uncultured Pseudokineococcus sp.]|uniref:GAF and ANTAR domain-containing protein n=1 Tax=uncultured Pseudokineococcus sp. TaxID=1642928 RepID=UPI00260BD89D|nr:GAF and ANTAR domain-containing protein [uncultured Pseudokineococcus sp.]
MVEPQRLARVFVELADTLVDDFDVVDFLTMLTERCVELLEADAAGLMLADQRGSLQLVASTARQSRLLELFELQHDQGPCLDCFASGQALMNISADEATQRWPTYAAAAAQAGFATTHAVPLRLRERVIGALNLFSVTGRDLVEDDLVVGRALADVATIGLLQERSLREQTVLSEQLQAALDSRVTIEQAKGVLAERARVDVPEAFTLMRAYARGQGTTLTMVATAVIAGTIDVSELVAGRHRTS